MRPNYFLSLLQLLTLKIDYLFHFFCSTNRLPHIQFWATVNPTSIYLFKNYNGKTRMCEISWNLKWLNNNKSITTSLTWFRCLYYCWEDFTLFWLWTSKCWLGMGQSFTCRLTLPRFWRKKTSVSARWNISSPNSQLWQPLLPSEIRERLQQITNI